MQKSNRETAIIPPYAAPMTATSGQFQGCLRKVNFPMQRPWETIFTMASNMKMVEQANLPKQIDLLMLLEFHK